MRRMSLALGVGMAVFALAGCGESSSVSAGAGAEASWVLASEPEGALSVSAAKLTAVEGQTITVVGRIGGRVEPLSADSPAFVIVDLEVPHCGEMGEDDHCATPWDYCCEPTDNLRANSATVQILGDVGPVAGGLEPMDEVVVVGEVGARPSPDVLTIRATGVHTRAGG